MKKMAKKLILCMFVIGMLALPTTVAHADDVSGNSTGEPIKYTVKREKEVRHILPSEECFVSDAVPYDAVLTSSDTRVVQVANSGLMRGRRAGKAKVTMTSDSERLKYIVTVDVTSEVDLIIFAGQSNMCGSGGNKYLAPTPAAGTAYEFDATTGSKKCLAMKEPFGQGTNRKKGYDDNKIYSVSGTLVSAFSIAYYKQTKMPVVGVPAAWGGSSTNTWLNRGLLNQTIKRTKLAKNTLKKRNIKIRHIYMVWYQGESDAQQGISEEKYIANMKKIYKKLKPIGVEQVMLIQIGRDKAHPEVGFPIMHAQAELCKTDKNFTFVSGRPKTYFDSYPAYYSDVIHINQYGLNEIGKEAGTNSGKYAKKHSKRSKKSK